MSLVWVAGCLTVHCRNYQFFLAAQQGTFDPAVLKLHPASSIGSH
jgi:hypothetical protein